MIERRIAKLVSFAAILFRFLDVFGAWFFMEHIPYMKTVTPRRTAKLPPELSDWEQLSAGMESVHGNSFQL